MSYGYLFTLLLLAVFTGLALFKIKWQGHRLFMVALPAGELPHLGLIFLGLSTLLAWQEGSFAEGYGTVQVAVAAVIAVGLLILLFRALQAPRVLSQLAREHGHPIRWPRGWWLRPLFFPFPWRPRSVRRVGPLKYGSHRRQRLDFYRPRDPQASGPVLVYLHGGGYHSGGNRREARALFYHLAEQGWTCISATYRLRPEHGFAEHIADARAVLRWAHDHADTHGGDTNQLVMAGSSAGGHLSAICALSQDPHRADRPRVDAVISLYAYYGRYYDHSEDETEPSSPLLLQAATAPPFFLTHGTHDSYVPVSDARKLARHLRAGSRRPVWYAELPGAQHGFDAYRSWRFSALLHTLDAFLREALTPTHHAHA